MLTEEMLEFARRACQVENKNIIWKNEKFYTHYYLLG